MAVSRRLNPIAHHGQTTSEIISIFMGVFSLSLGVVLAIVELLLKRRMASVMVFSMWLPISRNGVSVVLMCMSV